MTHLQRRFYMKINIKNNISIYLKNANEYSYIVMGEKEKGGKWVGVR